MASSDRIRIDLQDNSEQFLRELNEEKIPAILEAWGIQAEGNAKEIATEKGVVDTGLLRNSITWAIEGERANTPNYSSDDGSIVGSYEGIAEGGFLSSLLNRHRAVVYIGTNVYYSVYQEKGYRGHPGRPFLQPAVEDFKDEYKEIAENILADE